MGDWCRAALACALVAGCAVEGAPDVEPAQLSIEGASFSLGQALSIADGAVAVLNVDRGACGAYLGHGEHASLGDEEPLLLGLFAEGNAGIAAVDGEDPRLYVTSDAPDDAVVIAADPTDEGGAVRATVHITFDRALRTEWIGIDFVIVESRLDPPVVLDDSFVASPCR